MILWRLTKKGRDDLSGEGARLFGGRWNSPGHPVVYLADHPALALVEVLVHLDLDEFVAPEDFVMMKVDLPEEFPFHKEAAGDERRKGNEWLKAGLWPLLCVPSIVVPQACSWLLNPTHVRASEVQIATSELFPIDQRLTD